MPDSANEQESNVAPLPGVELDVEAAAAAQAEALARRDADNVVVLKNITSLNVGPERIIAGLMQHEFVRIVVVGVTKDSDFYFASSVADGGTVLWDLERAKLRLMRSAGEPPDYRDE